MFHLNAKSSAKSFGEKEIIEKHPLKLGMRWARKSKRICKNSNSGTDSQKTAHHKSTRQHILFGHTNKQPRVELTYLKRNIVDEIINNVISTP